MDDVAGGAAHALATRERALLGDLRELLARAEADEEASGALATAAADLDGLFLLVVCGEYNAGKSSLLNALLDADAMPEGVTPTTDRITVLGFGEPAAEEDEHGVVTRRLPLPALREFAFVDTPGTNAVIRQHQQLTERFVPRADLVLFVTSADRPFTGSESAFLELIASWGKKIVLVVNKIDLLDAADEAATDAAREEVLGFVRRHAREVLGEPEPRVFAVSSRRARAARRDGDEAALAASGLPELQRFVAAELGDLERLRLKLASPLGVAERVARDVRAAVAARRELLADDRRTLEAVERQRRQFEREMRREAETYLARIKTALVEVERRGEVFLDETVRLGNVLQLMRPEQVRAAFVRRVVREADREIDEAMSEMVDWFVQRNLQLWEDVVGFVQERRSAGDERVVGAVGGRFRMDRRELLAGLRDQAEEVLEGWDHEREAERLATSLQQAVVRTGLLQVSGLGLGAAVVAFLSGAAFDVTGVTLGLAAVGVGALMLPRRRARAKRELHQQLQELRDGLERSLDRQLARELERAGQALAGAIAPYARFVEGESERLGSLAGRLEGTAVELAALRREALALEPASTEA
jgi:small GTP-binding protein